MFSTDPGKRNDFITGLRQLADFLHAHPDVPVPVFGTDIAVHTDAIEDGGRQQVDQIAASLGSEIDPGPVDTHYKTMPRYFGPVSFYAVSISDAEMARYQALATYTGCVAPDEEAGNG